MPLFVQRQQSSGGSDTSASILAGTVARAMSETPTPRSMWEARYGSDDYVFGTDPNDFLRENLSKLSAGSVLCLAEGEGRNATFLAAAGLQVHSVDLAQQGVDKTRRLALQRGVHVDAVVGDLAEFDLGTDRWDSIVSIFAHMPAVVRRSLHRRVVAGLRPGGVFLLEAYTPDQIGRGTGGPAQADMTMTLAALREELAGLQFIHAAEMERVVIEGRSHTGMASVVQVIGQKPT